MNSDRVTFLTETLEKEGEDSFVRYALAKEYEKCGLLEEAIQHFIILQTNDPGYVGLYYHLGHIYAEIGQTELALKVYQEGIIVAKQQNDRHALAELMNAFTNLSIENDI